MSLKNTLNGLLDWRLEHKIWRISEKREKKALAMNGYSTGKAEGEVAYLRKWAPLLRFQTPYAYRLYSRYCGTTPDILSQTATLIINNTLNPQEFQLYYSDKNVFDRIFPEGAMPRTILRRVKGLTLDAAYRNVSLSDAQFRRLLKDCGTLVLKPTVDSDSGHGVILFHERPGGHFANDGTELTVRFFENYGRDTVLQLGVTQHPVMARLNPGSVNTMRIATYKSVVDGTVHVLSFVVRMGNAGSEVDNLHAGGKMILIGADGKSAPYCIDQYGQRYTTHNGLDFTTFSFGIPNYEGVLDFCKEIASSMPELHLLQHDITVDADGIPRCIEVNNSSFSMWIAQYMGIPALGSHTDEILDYVVRNRRYNRQLIVV